MSNPFANAPAAEGQNQSVEQANPTAAPTTQVPENTQPQQPVQQPVQPQAAPELQNPQQPAQPAQQQSTPAPTLEAGQELLCQISPGKFDAFIKVLSLLDDKNVINISNSQICQSINNGTAILMTDVSNLVGQNINLHILQPKRYLKLFKAIKSTTDIFIIDNPSQSQFIIRSGSTKLWLPKQIEDFEKDASPPSLDGIQGVGNTVIVSKEERTKINTLMSEQTHIILLTKDNQLKGYMIPETLEDSFAQYMSEEVTDTNSELKLTSYAFLNIPSDGNSEVSLGELNGQYWLSTKINTAIVEITILESINPAQDDKLLI